MKRYSTNSSEKRAGKRVCNREDRSRMDESQGKTAVGSFEVLPKPMQSENDKRDYRTIRLQNGLVALLISDMRPPLESCSRTSIKARKHSGSGRSRHESAGHEMEDGEEEDAEETDDEKEIEGDEKMAAAALAVGCGSFSDPEDIQGLAHFCEHMVFMGNKKYPEENSFDVFVKNSGGSSNAHTDCEETVFYFDVNSPHLSEALERFVQFFISPLMKKDSMQRERQAVENEYLEALPNDAHRKEQLLGSLARPGHPISRFMWGNQESLSETRTGLSDDQMHERLHEFQRQHYRANYMTLAVQADQPLDTLQDWVVSLFSEIASSSVPRPTFTQCGLPWDPARFHRLYYVLPVKDRHELTVTWQLPSMKQHYRTRPLGYISWLMGHEGRGSILSYLKQKTWAVSLVSGNSESGFEHNSAVSCFYVTVRLTDAGLKHVPDVLGAIFAYMAMLRHIGPQQRIYEEIQQIDLTSFRYQEESSPQDWVQSLADNMLNYAPEDFICGEFLLFHFDHDLIASCQDAMLPTNCNVMISSRSLELTPIDFDKTEEWFGTKYAEREIPSEWLPDGSSVSSLESHFHVPETNQFVARDFTLLDPGAPHTSHPERLVEEPFGQLFYRFDRKFNLPRAYICIRLCSDLPLQSALHAAMLDLMDNMLNYELTEDIYPAAVARLNYRLESTERGYTIRVDGFNEKLPELVYLIIDHLVHFEEKVFDSDVYNMLKAEQLKAYYNWFLKPTNMCKDLRLNVLKQRHWMAVEKHRALLNVTELGLRQFSRVFRSRLYMQMLVQGNMTQRQASDLYVSVKSRLNYEPLPPDLWPDIRVCQLPVGERFCRVASFNRGDTNTVVTNFYQWQPGTIHTACQLDLLMNLMEEPTFDFLRTQDQLGYYVFSLLRCVYGVLGYSITVNTQADKFTPDYVDERIEAFLAHFCDKLTEMSLEEFNQARQALIRNKQCADVSLEEEVNRNWSEILTREYVFDRLEREVAVLETLTLEHIQELFCNLRNTKRTCRKLAVQVVGCPSPSEPPPGEPVHSALCDKTGALTGPGVANLAHGLTLLTAPEASAQFLTSVENFKSELFLYPVTKIVE